MTNLSQRIPTKGPEGLTIDKTENRQRVISAVDGNSVSYESTLTTGPDVLCNILTDIGRKGHYGYIINDGEGDIQVSWSYNGTLYGGIHTLQPDERISLDQFTVQIIKLHWTGTDANYRILVM